MLNQVICGDNVEVMKKLDSESVDMVLTSPPYGSIRTYDGSFEWNFEEVAKELFRVVKKGGVVVWVVGDQVIKGSESGESFRQALHFKEIGFRIHDTMIYQKHNPTPGARGRYQQAFEYMFVLSKGTPKTFNCQLQPRSNECNDKRTHRIKTTIRDCGGKFRAPHMVEIRSHVPRHNIWKYKVGGGNTTSDKVAFGHPALFPEKLAEDHILSWSNEHDTILDPFCGSGTTLKMAKLNNRNFIGIDINKDYCNIAEIRVGLKEEKTTEKPADLTVPVRSGKSPLRYPGGKNLFTKIICPILGEFDEYREPFVGGGSIFMEMKNLFPDKKFWINDKFKDLIDFWMMARDNNRNLISKIIEIKLQFNDGKRLYDYIKHECDMSDELTSAAAFFIMNRISFSGVSFSGGFSHQSYDRRFTPSSIDRVSAIEEKLQNVKITNLDYEDVILSPSDESVVIYCDPPYEAAKKSGLYGKNGDMHKNFDCERFADVMSKCSYRFLISLENTQEVKSLFSFANVIDFPMYYGMRHGDGNTKIGNELLIANFELPGWQENQTEVKEG